MKTTINKKQLKEMVDSAVKSKLNEVRPASTPKSDLAIIAHRQNMTDAQNIVDWIRANAAKITPAVAFRLQKVIEGARMEIEKILPRERDSASGNTAPPAVEENHIPEI